MQHGWLMPDGLWLFVRCAAAVSSAYGSCRTTGVTAVVRAADGRRTTTFQL